MRGVRIGFETNGHKPLTQQERLQRRKLQQKRWGWKANPFRRLFCQKGIYADAVSYAIDWRLKVLADTTLGNGRSLVSKSGDDQILIENNEIIIVCPGFAQTPPDWLIEQALRYLKSKGNRTDWRAQVQIKRAVRHSHRHWARASNPIRPKRKFRHKNRHRRTRASA